MYKIKKYVGLPKHLFKEPKGDSTVFQSKEIQTVYFSRAWIYGLRIKKIPVSYVLFSNNEPVLIFPALQSKNEIELAGSTNGICSLCPIYFGPEEMYEDALIYFLRNIKKDRIVIDRLQEESETARILKAINGWAKVESSTTENVRIRFENGYDSWYLSLKKSVRQNLRTAYNRCATDGFEVRFELFKGGSISSGMMKELVTIYNNRHELHYGVKTSKLKRMYMEKYDFSTVSLFHNPYAIHAVIYIDGKIAGFFSGYYDTRTRSIIIPRLSIDPEYNRYSPGYLLINEAIRWFENDEDVVCLDLSTGNEKYKIDLGGEIYKKGRYIIAKHK